VSGAAYLSLASDTEASVLKHIQRMARLSLFLVLPVILFAGVYIWAQGVKKARDAAFEWQDLNKPNPSTLPPCNAESEGRVYEHPGNGHIYLCVGK